MLTILLHEDFLFWCHLFDTLCVSVIYMSMNFPSLGKFYSMMLYVVYCWPRFSYLMHEYNFLLSHKNIYSYWLYNIFWPVEEFILGYAHKFPMNSGIIYWQNLFHWFQICKGICETYGTSYIFVTPLGRYILCPVYNSF